MSNNRNEVNDILTEREIETAWGVSMPADMRTSFELDDVPTELREMVPYAVFWGASDDSIRESLLRLTPDSLKKNLKRAVAKFDDQLDDWLAGPQASNSNPTKAYIAFSAMRMSADFV